MRSCFGLRVAAALWACSSEAKIPDALERERHAGDDAPARLWLDAIWIVKDRNSNRDVARPLVVREAKTGREVDEVAAGVLIHHARSHLLLVEFAVELKHEVEGGCW